MNKGSGLNESRPDPETKARTEPWWGYFRGSPATPDLQHTLFGGPLFN